MKLFEEIIAAQMQQQRSKTQTAQPAATASGSLEIVRRDGDGTLVAIADLAKNASDIPNLRTKAYTFCARAGEVTLEIGGRDYRVTASWPGSPMVQKGGKIVALGAADSLDPKSVIGFTIAKGDEFAWFVTLQPTA